MQQKLADTARYGLSTETGNRQQELLTREIISDSGPRRGGDLSFQQLIVLIIPYLLILGFLSCVPVDETS